LLTLTDDLDMVILDSPRLGKFIDVTILKLANQ